MDRLAALIARSGFLAAAQGRVGRAFGLGAGAFVPWVDARVTYNFLRTLTAE